MVEEATASIQALAQETDQLSGLITQFHIGATHARSISPKARKRHIAGAA
jgi:hypothetical protein